MKYEDYLKLDSDARMRALNDNCFHDPSWKGKTAEDVYRHDVNKQSRPYYIVGILGLLALLAFMLFGWEHP